jgi:Ser/Thr protein kinase RdoA (MazF antagonist)
MTAGFDAGGLRLLASGRDADVFDRGDGTVLRRYRERPASFSTEAEARVMIHAATAGFPVPEVIEASGSDLVLSLVDGPTLLDAVLAAPHKLTWAGRMLGNLHRQLHEIDAPPGLSEPLGGGRSLLHLDLHPGNVLLSDYGPIVIDWTNAASGPGAADVAYTWVLIATGVPDGSFMARAMAGVGRGVLGRSFLNEVGKAEARGHLQAAARRRLADPNLRPVERRKVERLAR